MASIVQGKLRKRRVWIKATGWLWSEQGKSIVMCNITVCVAEVNANQPNQQTYNHSHLRSSRPGLCSGWCTLRTFPPSLSCFLSPLFHDTHRLSLLSSLWWCYYFYHPNKVAWSQRTEGCSEGENVCRDRWCRQGSSVACPSEQCPLGSKACPPEMEKERR